MGAAGAMVPQGVAMEPEDLRGLGALGEVPGTLALGGGRMALRARCLRRRRESWGWGAGECGAQWGARSCRVGRAQVPACACMWVCMRVCMCVCACVHVCLCVGGRGAFIHVWQHAFV